MVVFCRTTSFDSAKDIPSLEGKVILVTGATSGLGKQAVIEFARHKPLQIWLGARSLEKGLLAAEDVRRQVPDAPTLKPLVMDLASFESVKTAADAFRAESPRLDILMLNAGVMALPAGLSTDGYEIQWATNHMGHALLARLLVPVMAQTLRDNPGADVRVVAVSSYGHTQVPRGGFRFDTLKNEAESLGPYGRYYRSKLGNILWARHMARVHPEITFAAVDPGLVQTQLLDGAAPGWLTLVFRSMYGVISSVDKGVRNQLWASVSGDVRSGEYYESVGVGGKASANGRDDALAKKVWEWTEEELGSWLEEEESRAERK